MRLCLCLSVLSFVWFAYNLDNGKCKRLRAGASVALNEKIKKSRDSLWTQEIKAFFSAARLA
jgi:hypothetical protein